LARGTLESQRDKSRDRNARRVGWQVDRVTDQEIADDFRSAIDDLVDLHRLRTDEVNRRNSHRTA
jgi:very-short-patch-repair endonuclease